MLLSLYKIGHIPEFIANIIWQHEKKIILMFDVQE